jgi:hypothetical protein
MKYRLRTSDLPWRDIDGEVIALDLGSDTYLQANSAGTVIWSMLADGATVSELVTRLVSEFEVEPERARRDVQVFVGKLDAAGLLER